jgi:hypothetical protein
MKTYLLLALLIPLQSFAQNLWERNDKLVCVQNESNLDAIKNNLRQKYGKDCDYLRDSTRIVIGNIFKCPEGKFHSYFRTQKACEMFFAEGKKDLAKFAPPEIKDPKRWVKHFGSCMETATQSQVITMGLKTLNKFCECVAEKSTDKITAYIVQDCSIVLKAH